MGLGACSKVVEMSRMGSKGRESGMSAVHTASISTTKKKLSLGAGLSRVKLMTYRSLASAIFGV